MSYPGLVAALNRFFTEVSTLVSKKPENALLSDNSVRLEGRTVEQINQAAQERFNAHNGDKNNPHGVTVAQLGGVTTTYVDQYLTSRLSLGSLAVSRYGEIGDNDIGVSVTGKTVRFTKQNVAFIRGQSKVFDQFETVIQDEVTANKVYHVYLTIGDGVMEHLVRQESIPESLEVMYLGSIRYDASDNVQYAGFKPVVRVGINRLSLTPCGSGIPVTGGLPNSVAKLDSNWR